jgi:topoisomerase-4 subunit B
MKKEIKYDESKIKTLSSLEHIRLRTGMYIGRLGDGSNPDDGIYVLLKEVVDNAVDEFIMGNGKTVAVDVRDGSVRVRDYGRGIPLGKLVECVSVINTGAKYNDEVFQFSVGLNGVGTKAVNALSSHFRIVSVREGEFAEAVFERGVLKKERRDKVPKKNAAQFVTGTFVEFTPDAEVFGNYTFNTDFVEQRMKNYSYLNAGLTLSYNGKKYFSRNGLLDLLRAETSGGEDGTAAEGDTAACIYPIAYYLSPAESANAGAGKLEFAFTHTNNYGEQYFSYVNGQFTSDGGTHLAAFKEGLLKGVQAFFKKDYRSEDVRDGIIADCAV